MPEASKRIKETGSRASQLIRRGRWGVAASSALLLLALYPQVSFWRAQGGSWAGAYFSYHADEAAYLAYVKALIDGRPRRNDPYTGRDERPDAPQPESLFSIQFIPAYLIALPARLAGVSVQTAFIALRCLLAVASTLALYWLIASVTGREKLAAAGALFVLCCGSLARASLVLRLMGQSAAPLIYFPFLRSYLPALPFPFFFIFCALVWRALTTQHERVSYRSMLMVGLLFVLLVFSYFYLWTTAAAWLFCLASLWLVARPDNYRRDLKYLGGIALIAALGLLPYCFLLARRAAPTDTAQALTRTHAPDLFRLPELLGALILIVLLIGARRGWLGWRERRVLFIASLSLAPFVVFNQQLVTGYSLQPIHYEQFITNYVALVAVVLTCALLFARQLIEARRSINIALACVALLALSWGLLEMRFAFTTLVETNRLRDELRPAALRLAQLGAGADRVGHDPYPVVLCANVVQADSLPLDAPQAVLWAPHMRSFTGVTLTEDKERYYKQLYYTGTGAAQFDDLLRHRLIAPSTIFGWERVNQRLTVENKPITEEEFKAEVHRYAEFVAAFDHEQAARPTLAYVVTPADTNLTNLDRWYIRDAGERVGDLILYRVSLR